ncbi:hypothetical protein TNCV_3722151 [Trichonephila clavipes]|nr:hypothetical protein TNCV_3722151 [Trichonephila clavipes]
MFRSGNQSDARPHFLSPQASLVLIYRLTALGMKGWVDLTHPWNRTRTCGVEERNATPRPLCLNFESYMGFLGARRLL